MNQDHIKQIEALVNDAVLGEQVKSFLLSDVGQYLIHNIDNEISEAYIALKTVKASDSVAVYEAQNQLWRAEKMKEWLTLAVADGLRATKVLESRQDED